MGLKQKALGVASARGFCFSGGERLALLGQGAALEIDDALTVMLDGLRGHLGTLLVHQLAIEVQLVCQ